jgi:dipeptidyl aminopeptidase/acylaminoacyl peptidase
MDGDFVRSVSYVDHGSTVTEYFTESDSHFAELLQQAFPGKHVQLLTPVGDGNKAVLYVSAADDPGTYYLLDTRTGEAQGLSARYPEVEDYELARSEVFDVQTADGERVEAILTTPDEPNGVLLVNPHGGPVGIRNYARYDPEVQFFANRGYAVLNVNFRGSTGFGKEFLDTGRGQFGRQIEEDISAVVRRVVAERPFTDLCAIGASYGGYSAVMLSIRHPELYHCVVSMFGIFDLPLLFNTSNYTLLEDRRHLLAAVIGEYSEQLRDVSPFYLAEQVPAPVLLIAGTDDHIADIEQTNRLKYRLEQLSKPVEHFFYANTGHGHSNWQGDRHQFALIDDFIRRTLGLEPPAGSNASEVLRSEYELIAENFEDSELVEDNVALAARYHEKAAALDDNPEPATQRSP